MDQDRRINLAVSTVIMALRTVNFSQPFQALQPELREPLQVNRTCQERPNHWILRWSKQMLIEAALTERERNMLTPKSIKFISILTGIMIAIVMTVLLHIPGLLLGAIVGAFAGVYLKEHLEKMQPENRRRHRRMMRHEGMR
jgi:ABC-type phosphate transport system permease subunit